MHVDAEQDSPVTRHWLRVDSCLHASSTGDQRHSDTGMLKRRTSFSPMLERAKQRLISGIRGTGNKKNVLLVVVRIAILALLLLLKLALWHS